MSMVRFGSWGLAIAVVIAGAPVRAGGPADFMMRTSVEGLDLEGQPLLWNSREMFLLGRDGMLYTFDPRAARNSLRTANRFVPYDSGEMRMRLRAEFGKSYRIGATQHFVVVHPDGAWNKWPEHLESLFRRFVQAVRVRGFTIHEPPALLAAVIFRNQADYFAYAASQGTEVQPGLLGHYDPESNRIFLFDATGAAAGGDWEGNRSTLVHEAVHQTAYNIGVHRRFAEQPRWLVEGLAMVFESPQAWNGSAGDAGGRVHAGRLADFRAREAERPADWALRLVASDQGFQTDAQAAYAEAWALSFYLSERRPHNYARLLRRAADREAFATYKSAQRVNDFTAEMGSDWTMLDARIQSFIAELP